MIMYGIRIDMSGLQRMDTRLQELFHSANLGTESSSCRPSSGSFSAFNFYRNTSLLAARWAVVV